MSEDDKKPPLKFPDSSKRILDDAVHVRTLYFKGSADLPTEQQQARISNIERSGRPRYEILYLPRIGMYHVCAFEPRGAGDGRPQKPTHTFLVPREWAVADLEPA